MKKSLISKLSIGYITEIVKKCYNISEVTISIYKNINCGNRNTVKTYINDNNIDITHFKKRDYSSLHLRNKINLFYILIENSTYTSTSTLKKRLYNEGIKKRECELCGQNENWRGQKMSLILDYINGVNNDNRIENLRIVCPNCNATLPTHGGKNQKKISTKKEKIVKIRTSKRKIENRSSIDTLKEEIKELGYRGTGKKYGVSDNAIRKWIK